MELEGMVHALEEIRRLLKPTGYLIDIHPIRKAARIQVYQGGTLLFTESDPGYDYKDKTRHADDALEEVVRRGLFRIEGGSEFELVTYASSLAEMDDYWAKYGAFNDEPKDEAIIALQNEVYARADEIMRNALDAELADYERARITRLKPSVKGR
jgi:hypothetical protein